MKSKVAELLERYGYAQDAEPADYNIRYWRSERCGLPVSLVNGIWECCDDAKLQRRHGQQGGFAAARTRDPALSEGGKMSVSKGYFERGSARTRHDPMIS